jgi:hypothetical protein
MVEQRDDKPRDQEAIRVAFSAQQEALRVAEGGLPAGPGLEAMLAKISAEVTAAAQRKRLREIAAIPQPIR